MKFTPAGGTVRVLAAEELDGGLSLTVADNGIGVDDKHLPKITEPFHQVEEAFHREHGGAGLGLHIVANMVRLHGAELDISSELGVGTKITITFPKERTEKAENVVRLHDGASRATDT